MRYITGKCGQACLAWSEEKDTDKWLTWQEAVGLVPVGAGVVHGVVGHPQQRSPGNYECAAAQHEVVAVAHPDLADAHRRIHAQHLLHPA